jgi:hypothetical protein
MPTSVGNILQGVMEITSKLIDGILLSVDKPLDILLSG